MTRQASAILFLSCLLLCAAASEGRAADMDWDYTRGRKLDFLRVFVYGEIEPGDLAKLETIYALGEGVFTGKSPIESSRYQDWSCRYASKNVCQTPDQIAISPDDKKLEPLIRIDSPGGDLTEAIRIGRWVRQKAGTVTVPTKSKCASACVLILAAGVSKNVGGQVIIHRPYFRAMPDGDVATELREVLQLTRAYLSEMNIPEALADEMFSIAPQNGAVLSADALARYRLDGTDIVQQETQDLRRAEKLGITRDELLQRTRAVSRAIELGACRDKMPGERPPDDSDSWLEYDRCIVELSASFGLTD